MRVRRKIAGAIGAILLAVCFVVAAASRLYFLRTTVAQESTHATENVIRACNAIENEVDDLDRLVADWAPWDDSYAFVEDRNQAFIDSNLGDATFVSNGVNAMLFLDAEGHAVFEKFVDLENERQAPMPESLLDELSRTSILTRHSDVQGSSKGVLILPDRVALVASRPIVTSDYEGPIHGTLVMVRLLTRSAIDEIARLTQLSLSLHRIEQAEQLDEYKDVLPELRAGTRAVVRANARDLLGGYAFMEDVYGHPGLILRVNQPRVFYRQFLSSQRYFLVALCVSGGLCCLVMVSMMDRLILMRLALVGNFVKSIRTSRDFSARVAVSGHDEISMLGESVNTMLEALERESNERKRAEEALRFAQFAVDNAAEGVLWADADGRFVYVNEAACRMLGYSREELAAKSVPDVQQGFAVSAWPEHLAELREHGSLTFESWYRRKDGTPFPIEITGNYLEFDGKAYECAFVRDATERKRVEQALRESQHFLEEITDAAPYFICVYDPTASEVVFVNSQSETLLGYLPTDFGAIADILAEAMAHTEGAEGEEDLLDKFVLAGDGEIVRQDLQLRHASGDLRWFRTQGVVFARTGDDEVSQVLLLAEDITEHRILEEEFRQSQKMEAIGQLAGGIAHDFNNVLSAILGHAQVLTLEAAPNSLVYDGAKTIERAARRASELSRQLLGFARRGKKQAIPVDLHRTIRDVIQLLRRTLDKKIRISERLSAPGAMVIGDPGELEQVLVNLAVNARDAMEFGGELTFITDCAFVDAAYCDVHFDATPGYYLRVSVQDTGVGIPSENLDRIFQPFFTTKEAGKGTGLGLAMVYGTTKSHAGFVQVDSKVGVGTRFDLFFPFADAASPVVEVETEAEIAQGSGRILLVDDEEIIREAVGRMLEKLGYEVVTAENGETALNYYREHADEIDLVMIDMIMPVMAGDECFRELRAFNPTVKVVLSTGYALDEKMQEIVRQGVLGVLQKPYRIQDISAVLPKALRCA